MTATPLSLSITIAGSPDLLGEVYAALYRITGRSTVEMRHAVRDGQPIYRAALFGNDHLEVVPRLEKAAAHLDALGIPFVVHEWDDGGHEQISRETMREILEADGGEISVG